MADIRAIANGNWSNPAIWAPNPPAAGDVVRPNNFTVTIDVNVTVTEIRNDAGGGAVVGGSFTLNDGVTVTASNGFFGTYAPAAIGLLNYNGAGTVTLNGNIDGSRSGVTDTCAVSNNSSGTIIINGNLTSAGSGGTSQTLRNQSTGRFTITGNLTSISGILIRNNAGITTINGSISANSTTAIQNTSGTINISGGTYSSSGGVILTNTTGTVTINGNTSATTTLGINAITNTGSGTITFIGNITNNITAVSVTGNLVVNSGSGMINVTGNLTGAAIGNNANSNTILNSSTGTVNVTGNVTANSTNASSTISRSLTIENSSGGTINVTGTITGPQSTPAINSINVCNAIRNSGNGVVNIIGNIVGTLGGVNILTAVANISLGTINITGNATGGSTGLAVANTSTGTITVNGNAIGGTAFQAIEGVNAAGNTIIEKAIYTSQGQSPITGYIKFKTTNPEIDVLREDSVIVTLRDPLNVSGLLPNPSNVRSGTTYNNGSSTGTLAMPANNLVQLGVPVDNTLGTGNLTPQDFWDYLISNGFVGGSIGERLKNASTVESTGAQIASF